MAETGDNIFDHYQKYKATPEIFGEIDLNVFGLLFNDLLFSNPIDNRYDTKKYLESYKQELKNRYEAKKGICKWYSLSVIRNIIETKHQKPSAKEYKEKILFSSLPLF